MKVVKQDDSIIRVEMSVAEAEKLLLEAISTKLGCDLPEFKGTSLEQDAVHVYFESFEPKISYSEVLV